MPRSTVVNEVKHSSFSFPTRPTSVSDVGNPLRDIHAAEKPLGRHTWIASQVASTPVD